MCNSFNNNPDLITEDPPTTTIRSISDIKLQSNSEQFKSVYAVHQNIRSLRRNFDLLVTNLDAFMSFPTLIFVSEIWIYSFEVDEFNLPNYKFYANPNDSYPAGGWEFL